MSALDSLSLTAIPLRRGAARPSPRDPRAGEGCHGPRARQVVVGLRREFQSRTRPASLARALATEGIRR